MVAKSTADFPFWPYTYIHTYYVLENTNVILLRKLSRNLNEQECIHTKPGESISFNSILCYFIACLCVHIYALI